MEKEDLEDYRTLYMIRGNDERNIDYSVILDAYFTYLSMFAVEEERYEDFYKDTSFLYTVVNGFNYYQEEMFGFGNDVDDLMLAQYIYSKNEEIREKLLLKDINKTQEEADDNIDSIDDNIFKVTMLCQNSICNSSNQTEESSMLIRQLFCNSFAIATTLEKYKGNYIGV